MPGPLKGRTILVTRARSQAGVFTEALRALGARVLEIPAIEVIPTGNTGLDEAIRSLKEYDWIVFTSVNGVEIFFRRIAELIPGHRVVRPRICSIGPATSERIRTFGHKVGLQPELFQAEGILEAFSTLYRGDLTHLKILLPRARAARQILPRRLRQLGAEVDVIPVYETVLPSGSSSKLLRLLEETQLDLITFTSSSTVRNFVSLAGGAARLAGYKCAAIGPITANTARELGLQVVLQPAESTIPDFVEAIKTYLSTEYPCSSIR